MAEQSVRIPVNKLVPFMEDACVAMGAPQEDARIIADVLITSDLWGVRSHGVAHLKMYYERMKAGLQLPVTQTTVVKDTPTTAVLDGGNGMGHVVAHKAMTLAIRKAKKYGLGMVAVRNSTHFGIAGYYYPLMAVQAGMIGISRGTNARPSIAPHLRRREHARHQSAHLRHAHRRKISRSCSIAPPPSSSAARSKSTPSQQGNAQGWVINKDGSSTTVAATHRGNEPRKCRPPSPRWFRRNPWVDIRAMGWQPWSRSSRPHSRMALTCGA